MNRGEKLARLDKFTQLTESSGWIPSRKEYPPVLTDEDERILSRVWKELDEELAIQEHDPLRPFQTEGEL